MPAIFNALFEKFGPTLTFEQAATALHCKSIKTAYTARSRGIFPLRTIDLGGRLGCSVVDLAEFLTTGVHQKNLPSVPQSRKPGRPRKDLLFSKAGEVCARTGHDGLNLEDKVLLSIAIRLQAEIFLINELRRLTGDATYWCESENQFGRLVKDYLGYSPPAPAVRTLEKVSITVSSNIHLNSFMYEPIIDLTIDHLISLYSEVGGLNV